MKNIFFVILHYNNMSDTEGCIASILSQNTKNAILKILIIDNASPNGSGKKLSKKYENQPNIDVILLDKNYGFSKANNIGYSLAKNSGADTIIMTNSDTIFCDSMFIEKLIKTEEKNASVAIIAPDIINKLGQHQNPLRDKELANTTAIKNILYKTFIIVISYCPLIGSKLIESEEKREKKWLKRYYENREQTSNAQSFFVPFGACIIYTKNWIHREDIAFPSSTFMYLEEDFLAKYICKKGYLINYAEQLKVSHMEGGSSNYAKTKKAIIRNRYRRQVKSLITYTLCRTKK